MPTVTREDRWLRLLTASAAAVIACLLVAAPAAAAPDAAWFGRQTVRLFILVGAFGFFAWVLTRPTFFQRAVGAATPGALGAIRALVCGRLFFMVIAEDLPTLASIPDSLRRPMGVVEFLFALPIGFDRLAESPDALRALQIGAALLLFLAAIGWRTRLTVPLGGLGAFLVAGLLRTYSFFWHQDLIALYLIGVLSLTPCGDGFSLDRLVAVARGRPGPPDRPAALYGWARYACWAVVALPYVAAGVSKLRNGGMSWWNGTTMRRALLTDTLNPMQFDWKLSLDLAYLPDSVFTVLGLSAVAGEVSYGLVLLFPWARLILPVMMGLMHISIIFLQNILFMDLILLQLIFFDWTKVRRWVGQRLNARRAPLEVRFDGDSARCRRTAEILRRLDLFERLSLGASADAPAGEVYVIAGGRVLRGVEACGRIALFLPLGWLVVPFLWIPGVAAVGTRLYTRIADGQAAPLAVDQPVSRASRRAPLAVAAVAALLVANVYYQIEFFPLTALQMYSHAQWRSEEPIDFYRVLAQRESGDASKAVWDDVVGPYARNARYRGFIWGFFRDPKQAARLRQFLTAIGEAYNRRAPVGQRVTHLEVQRWTTAWKDPRAGQLLDRLVVDFPLDSDASIARSPDSGT